MKTFNFPIFLTWLRIGVIPVFVVLYYLPTNWIGINLRDDIGLFVFVLAAVTDWLDGWLARRWGQTSAFGAFLDPVADKLMVCTALLILLKLDRLDFLIALIIIGRELTISALREWMATIGERSSIAVSWLGKFKTIAQMIAIPCLLFSQTLWGIDFNLLGSILIYIATILTLWSMCYYLRKAWPLLK